MKRIWLILGAIILIGLSVFIYKKFLSKPEIKVLETAKVEKAKLPKKS